jgi:hypothetical protein
MTVTALPENLADQHATRLTAQHQLRREVATAQVILPEEYSGAPRRRTRREGSVSGARGTAERHLPPREPADGRRPDQWFQVHPRRSRAPAQNWWRSPHQRQLTLLRQHEQQAWSGKQHSGRRRMSLPPAPPSFRSMHAEVSRRSRRHGCCGREVVEGFARSIQRPDIPSAGPLRRGPQIRAGRTFRPPPSPRA